MGRNSYDDGITVNRSTQVTESVAAGGAFIIADVYPSIDGGQFPIKRIVGEPIEVWVDIYRDGHQVIATALVWRREEDRDWHRAPMHHGGDDRWGGSFIPDELGRHVYAIEAWTDDFATWRRSFELKQEAGQDTTLDALEGAGMLTKAQGIGPAASALILRQCEEYLRTGDAAPLLVPALCDAMAESQWRSDLTRSQLFPLMVDRPLARSSAWYAMMPRSQSKIPGQHGTFKDCMARLPDVAAMGFDVVYLPPIHPIGRTNRKGPNNAANARPGDPGSPYAIGSAAGGHDALHPELGRLADFRDFVAASKMLGIEVALDFAAQCSPDHPWLAQHPGWFRKRPDGSLRYAESPPQQRTDIVNPDFGCKDAGSLWNALRDVVLFWIDQGVRIFHVDEPHTKPLQFWQWLIHAVQLRHPDVIFFAASYTRRKLVKGLAKLGFTQSQSYFMWRTQKLELEAYVRELTDYPERDFCRPNFFVSTLGVLPFQLQGGEPWMFKSRFALAATLSAAYGITNGFELIEHEAIPGKEEYLDSEECAIRVRDWEQPDNIKPYICTLNAVRRANPALQQTTRIQFVPIDDADVIGFVKQSVDRGNTVAVVIALSREPHEFWFPIPDIRTGAAHERSPVAVVENLITGERHPLEWGGIRLRVDPMHDPALLFRCLT
jgi:starch synthase (maltosyl-transferring)